MGQNDLNIDVNAETRKVVTEVLRKSRADVVLTHSPSDYMSDHEVTSRLVRDACFCAATPNYATDDPHPAKPLDHIPTLFYADPLEGLDIFGARIIPQFHVDISAHMSLKREMLACHASQRDWLRAQHGIDQYLIAMEEWAKKCGEEAGFGYAEGFRQHLGHAFPSKNILKEVLGDHCRVRS
jgi:LmbE family N-acetylglucosaminyl deacetylase